MSAFASTIVEQKYAHTKKDGTKENWSEIAHRVATEVLSVVDVDQKTIDKVEELIVKRKFIPGGRYLYSSGRPFHQTNNCILLRAEDSREGWADLLNKGTLALMTGAGIGSDYSAIRGEGKIIRKTGGTSTGPLSLMQMVNEAGRHIMQGGARRCLPSGSLVHCKSGLKRIEEVSPGEEVLTADGFHVVKANLKQGEQDVVKIKTQVGYFYCTPNHKVAVLTSATGEYEWKQASDLQEDDRMLFTAESIPGSQTSLPPSNYERPSRAYSAKEITVPDLDTDMAWFIGYYQANGHSAIRNSTDTKRNGTVSVSIPTAAPQVIEKIVLQISRFGVNARVTESDGEWVNVRVASVPLALYMQSHIKVSNEEIRTPDFILQGTEEIRSAYIAGILDGDGSIASRPISIASSIYPNFLSDVQAVCASLGFATYFGWTRPPQGKWKPLYHLNIKGSKQENKFRDLVKSHLVYKIPAFNERKREQFSYSVPPEMVANLPSEQRDGLHKNYKVNFPLENIEKAIGKYLPFTPVRVIEVEESLYVQTYDIEVADRNEFYCNGFLVHNSAIWAGLLWSHPDIHKFITIKNWSAEVKALKEKDFNFPAVLDGTNVSVILDDEFFEAFHDEDHPKHPLAHSVYWTTVKQMLSTAEPGFSINVGENAGETLRNACTEVSSRDDSDVCNLGSINLSRIDSVEEMREVVEYGTLFLLAGSVYSDVSYPKIDQMRTKNRRLGLGLMGIHEWLLKNGKKYGPDDDLAELLEVYATSTKVAERYANEWGISPPVKTRAIAPNGTIGIAAETTTSAEPIFCVAFKRRYLKHKIWNYQYVVDPTADRLIKAGIHADHIEDAYKLAEDVERRVAFQAWLQRYVDHGISSTINLPAWGSEFNNESRLHDFGNMLIKYLPQLRGITCYPDGARGGQPIVPCQYSTAIKHIGKVYEEGTVAEIRANSEMESVIKNSESELTDEQASMPLDICDITKPGSCG